MRTKKTEVTIICDACKRVVDNPRENWEGKGKIDCTLHDEEFDKYHDLHEDCYSQIYRAILGAIRRLRGQKPAPVRGHSKLSDKPGGI